MRKYGPWVYGDTATAFVYTPKDRTGANFAGLTTATGSTLIGKSPTTKESISVAGVISAPDVTYSNPLGAATLPDSANADYFVCRVRITLDGGAISWESDEFILWLVRFPAP